MVIHVVYLIGGFLILRAIVMRLFDHLAYMQAVREWGTDDLVSYDSFPTGERRWVPRSEWERS